MAIKHRYSIIAVSLIVMVLTILYIGCENPDNPYPLARPAGDPFQDELVVVNFKQTNTVYLSWQPDEAADEFILMRKDDLDSDADYEPLKTFTDTLNDTSYTDSDLDDGDLFMYRLDKRRGKKIFVGKKKAYGMGAPRGDDYEWATGYENNDVEGRESLLDPSVSPGPVLTGTVYYYRFSDNHKESDTDWFAVNVAPNTTITIIFGQPDVAPGGNCDFRMVNKNRSDTPVRAVADKSRIDFKLVNTTPVEKLMKFTITPSDVAGSKFAAYTSSSPGGTSIGYSMQLYKGDPFLDVPVADSFKESSTIFLSWKPDDAADEFFLYRKDDKDMAAVFQLYQTFAGANRNITTYTDNVSLDDRYIYRLDKKRRADPVLQGVEYGYGVGADAGDGHEPNDSVSTATLLAGGEPLTCQIHYYRFNENNKVLADEDWFDIPIGAGTTVLLKFTQVETILADEYCSFKMFVENGLMRTGIIANVTNTDNNKLTNSEFHGIRQKICISPDLAYTAGEFYKFGLYNPGSTTGGTTVHYSIQIFDAQAEN